MRKAARNDLVTNRLLTRCRLRSARRPSPTMGAMAPNPPRTSTMSATARAISVAAPGAMATRAALSAGTSFTPSPNMATFCPCDVRARTMRSLSSGVARPMTPACATAAARATSSCGSVDASTGACARTPQSRAMAPTVDGASPDSTCTGTPSRARNAMASRTSGCSVSDRAMTPRGSRPAGGPSSTPGVPKVTLPCASTSTRRPASDSRATSSASGPGLMTPGAPSTRASSPTRIPDQRLRDEKCTTSSGACRTPGTARAMAAMVSS